jgi:protein-S-isoprenylcysteine O-methyltransferase Ste14
MEKKMIETIFVITLFVIYLGLWSIKRIILIKTENIDPQVMEKSISNIQKYMNGFTKILTIYMVILIPLHSLNIQFFGFFSRFDLLNGIQADIIGFCLGLIGLLFCLYAQIKMGKSWRVGIDQNTKTELITT